MAEPLSLVTIAPTRPGGWSTSCDVRVYRDRPSMIEDLNVTLTENGLPPTELGQTIALTLLWVATDGTSVRPVILLATDRLSVPVIAHEVTHAMLASYSTKIRDGQPADAYLNHYVEAPAYWVEDITRGILEHLAEVGVPVETIPA